MPTIWRILSARGFVTPQPHRCPKSSYQRLAADARNGRWQLDITHYRLADDTEVEILNMIDDHSRLCIASTTRRIFTAGDVNTAFTAATSAYGDPANLLSDNGAVFTGAPRRGGPLPRPPRPHRLIRRDHPAPQQPLHHIGLGRRHAGTRVITTDGELLRELTFGPGRDYQPQARP